MQLQLMWMVAFKPYNHIIKAVQINSIFVFHGRKNVSRFERYEGEWNNTWNFRNVWGSL